MIALESGACSVSLLGPHARARVAWMGGDGATQLLHTQPTGPPTTPGLPTHTAPAVSRFHAPSAAAPSLIHSPCSCCTAAHHTAQAPTERLLPPQASPPPTHEPRNECSSGLQPAIPAAIASHIGTATMTSFFGRFKAGNVSVSCAVRCAYQQITRSSGQQLST